MFCCLGDLEAGADIIEADHFDDHVCRLLPYDREEVHKILLFAFWAFDKKPPKFFSCAKPVAEQFDSSQAAATPATIDNVKECKRVWAAANTEALTKAISSLAP